MFNKQGYITSGVTKQAKSPIPTRFGAFLWVNPKRMALSVFELGIPLSYWV